MTAQDHEVWVWLDTGVERARSGLGSVLVRDLAGEEWRCCTVLYCTVLYCTVLYCTVLYCTVL